MTQEDETKIRGLITASPRRRGGTNLVYQDYEIGPRTFAQSKSTDFLEAMKERLPELTSSRVVDPSLEGYDPRINIATAFVRGRRPSPA